MTETNGGTTKIHYLGLLANAGAGLSEVALKRGLSFDLVSYPRLLSLLSTLRNLPVRKVASQYLSPPLHTGHWDRNFDDYDAVVVTGGFEADLQINDDGSLKELPSEFGRFDAQALRSHLHPVLEKCRLFEKGNVRNVVDEYYLVIEGQVESFSRKVSPMDFGGDHFRPQPHEIERLKRFLSSFELPDEESFAGLAHQHYDQALRLTHRPLSFTMLMIAMEVLYGAGGAHKVARNCAVLLGGTKAESVDIFRKVKDLYRTRSRFLHSGKVNTVSKDNVETLESCVRDSIKAVVRADPGGKTELHRNLNKLGFGQGPDEYDLSPYIDWV